jgi:putative hydrolase of the HAD superfamily
MYKFYGFKDFIYSLVTCAFLYTLGILTAISTGNYTVEDGVVLKIVTFYDSHNYIYGLILVILTALFIHFAQNMPFLKERMKNKVNKNVVINKFEEFVEDAKLLKVFGGDLSFLSNSSKQLEKMKSLGSKCQILFHHPSNPDTESKMKSIYKELLDANVDLRVYTVEEENEISNFRGQIKQYDFGKNQSLFTQVTNEENGLKLYEPINLENKMISDLVKDKFDKMHENSKHPTIKHILLDLGGVFFDGDYYTDFLERINNLLGTDIKPHVNQKVLLDRELNLGTIDIVQFLESITNKNLTEDNKKEIYKLWNNVWKPNDEMVSIVKKIKDRQFEIYPFSNLDQDNGLVYIERGDFDCFTKRRFLSFEMKMTKPEKQIFDKILKDLDVLPHEVLVIDDQDKNIEEAKNHGFEVLKFVNTQLLREDLEKKNIL